MPKPIEIHHVESPDIEGYSSVTQNGVTTIVPDSALPYILNELSPGAPPVTTQADPIGFAPDENGNWFIKR